jgi:hypothetical protein
VQNCSLLANTSEKQLCMIYLDCVFQAKEAGMVCERQQMILQVNEHHPHSQTNDVDLKPTGEVKQTLLERFCCEREEEQQMKHDCSLPGCTPKAARERPGEPGAGAAPP